jgi:hypothetical protein
VLQLHADSKVIAFFHIPAIDVNIDAGHFSSICRSVVTWTGYLRCELRADALLFRCKLIMKLALLLVTFVIQLQVDSKVIVFHIICGSMLRLNADKEPCGMMTQQRRFGCQLTSS